MITSARQNGESRKNTRQMAWAISESHAVLVLFTFTDRCAWLKLLTETVRNRICGDKEGQAQA